MKLCSEFWEKYEKAPFLKFLALFSKFSFLAITREELFRTCGLHQNEPTKSLLLETKIQNNSPTQTGEIFERLSGNVNLVPFENRIFGLDFRGDGVNVFEILESAFRKYGLCSIWKSNQISVCSFPSRNLRVWKVVPKGPRPTPSLTRAQISDEPDFFQTCGFHHELEKG